VLDASGPRPPAGVKAEIVRAAAAVFAEKGYAHTTLEAVARRVGLGRTGLLHHYPSKEALFRAVLDGERARVEVGAGGTGVDALRELGACLGDAASARLVQVLEGEVLAGNAVAAKHVAERLAAVRAEIRRRLGDVAEPDAAATLVAAAVNGLQKLWLLDPDAPTAQAFELLLNLLEPRLTAD
jgi:AcrR family transcriptional regulator